MDLAELEQRLTRIEDLEDIKQLKATYCDICDDDHNPDRITTIFAEDGIWEGAGFGKAQGHAPIRDGIYQIFESTNTSYEISINNYIFRINQTLYFRTSFLLLKYLNKKTIT